MIEQKEHFHGSDLEKIEAVYGIKKEEIVSFAANVNPLGVSFRLRETLASHIDAITSYPDREYTSLRKAIASYLSSKPEYIITGNGSTELISILIQLKKPKKALLVAPTYSEYEREITLAGGSIDYFELKEEDNFKLNLPALSEALKNNIDLLIICNPNNPTSTAVSQSEMCQIAEVCKKYGTFIMVDETYVEFAENVEEITSVPLTADYDNLIILRGISKFFAAPGLRLGYAVCGNTDLIKEINEKKNPWTINSLAAIAGEIMFSDEDYKKETRQLISSERARIVKALSRLPEYKVYPSAANFVLIRIEKEGLTSEMLFEMAIKKGLMIRDCSTFPYLDNHYIRFCFMSPEKNDELLAVLKEAIL